MGNIRCLDTTNSYLEGYWDDYHNCWCNSYRWVWIRGKEIKCDIDRLEDFVKFSSERIHKDDFVKCTHCNNMMPDPNLYERLHILPEYNGNYFCSRDCRDAYKAWYEDNYCFYDQVRNQYINKDDDTAVKLLYLAWDEVGTITCSKSMLNKYIEGNMVTIISGLQLELDSSVPMFCGGMVRPLDRFHRYMERFGDRVIEVSKEIIEQNHRRNVDVIYTKNEVNEIV